MMTQEPQHPQGPQDPNSLEGNPPVGITPEGQNGGAGQDPQTPGSQQGGQQWGQPAQNPPPYPGQTPQQPVYPSQQQWRQPPQPGQYAQPGQQPQWGQPGQQQYPGQPGQQQYPGQPGQQQYPGQYPAQAPHQPQWGQYAQPGFNTYVAPPKPGVIPLRPLGVGEILDGAFQAARRNGKAMFGSALIFQLAITALTLLIMALAFGSFLGELMATDTFNESDPAAFEALGGELVTFSVSILLTSFLSVLIQMVLQGALVIPVLRAVLNRKTSFGEMWRLVKPRVVSLIVLALLYAAALLVAILVYTGIVVALIFAIGPDSGGSALGVIGLAILISLPFLLGSVWIATKVLVAPAAVVVENVGAVAGIKRSWQLTRNNWWRTFGVSILAAIIAGVIGSVITTPVTMLASFLMPLLVGTQPTPEQLGTQMIIIQAISGIVGALVGAVTLAFQTGVMALIYVDLRMRRDGFDITLLKEAETGKDDGGIPGSPSPASQVPGGYATGAYNSDPNGTYPDGTNPPTTGQPPGNYGQ